jgi:hypothetical protein
LLVNTYKLTMNKKLGRDGVNVFSDK